MVINGYAVKKDGRLVGIFESYGAARLQAQISSRPYLSRIEGDSDVIVADNIDVIPFIAFEEEFDEDLYKRVYEAQMKFVDTDIRESIFYLKENMDDATRAEIESILKGEVSANE